MSTAQPNSPSDEAAFILDSVGVRFSGTERAVLEDVSLSIRRGDFLSVVGPSGCGKSTLLRILAGLLTPSAGRVVNSITKNGERNRIGFVFQHPTLLPWRTAVENLKLPLELGSLRSRAVLLEKDCVSLLEQVGLSAADAGKRPSELSGGMQMRLSLARALATRPDVLLLDEPFAAVDDLLRLRLQEDVRRLHEDRGLTTILVTHNVAEAAFLSDRVIILNGTPAYLESDISVLTTMKRSSSYRDSEELFAHVKAVNASLFRLPKKASESKV